MQSARQALRDLNLDAVVLQHIVEIGSRIVTSCDSIGNSLSVIVLADNGNLIGRSILGISTSQLVVCQGINYISRIGEQTSVLNLSIIVVNLNTWEYDACNRSATLTGSPTTGRTLQQHQTTDIDDGRQLVLLILGNIARIHVARPVCREVHGVISNNIQTIVQPTSVDGSPINIVVVIDSYATEILSFIQNGDIHACRLIAVSLFTTSVKNGFHIKIYTENL